MRRSLRPVVEAQHGGDDAVERRRDLEVAAAVAVRHCTAGRIRARHEAEVGAEGAR
jgi:hypothetical protein